MSEQLLCTGDVAKLVGVTVWNLYDQIRAGKVPPPGRVGGSYLWAESDVENARKYAVKKRKYSRRKAD
jgi:predicted DNA-binding transcriptional regulator AlpA